MTATTALPAEPTIPALMDHQAEHQPDATALVQVETGQTLTFAALRERARAFGRALLAHGVGRGDRVATMLPNEIDSVVSWFGCTTIGAIETPIGIAYRGPLLARLLDTADTTCLVVTEQTLDVVLEVVDEVPRLQHVVVLGTWSQGSRRPPSTAALVQEEEFYGASSTTVAPEQAGVGMTDIACMLFTSGTTGNSRGVLCTFAQEHESALAAPPVFSDDEVVYSTSPPNHVGQKLFLYKALITGRPFVMREAFSASAFWDDVRKHACTHTLLLGATTSYLLRQPATEADAENPLRSVVMIPLHPDVNAFRSRFSVQVHSMFNMTEICPVTVITDDEVTDHRSCGRIREGFDWRLVDDRDFEVPLGTPGELVLRPHRPWTFSQGYWRDPEKTVEAWRNLWFHTGDVFSADGEGYLRYLDRTKDVVRRRGENVSSAELEHLVTLHPDVEECAVVGVPSEHTEEDIRVFVVPRPGGAFDERELVRFLRERAPSFMLPRYVDRVDALPKTPTLKVRKGVLRNTPVDPGAFDAARDGT